MDEDDIRGPQKGHGFAAGCVEGLCRRVVKGKVQRAQKVVVSPLRGDEYICRLSANPFRLAALATHPLDRGGQGRYVLTFPPDTVILSRRRRILVPGTWETTGNKYQSAGNTSGVCP